MSFDTGTRHSVLAALRPRTGQRLTRAVVATYSLDLVALLGLVLALGGKGEEEFDASRIGLVEAFRAVRGRLLVIHQRGRIVPTRRYRRILPLLDTMLRDIGSDERYGSWHPKMALVRYERDGVAEWRLWIGSRNLTGSTDLDAGILLVSDRARGGRMIPAVAGLAGNLLREADWSQEHLVELGSARWRTPAGTSVRSILWRRPGEHRSFLAAMHSGRPGGLHAVSPFVDRTGLAEITGLRTGDVTLLTTTQSAMDCSPVSRVHFKVGPPAMPAEEVQVAEAQESLDADFSDPPIAGIHAKLLLVPRRSNSDLMVGSANLTSRGLLGPNGEAAIVLVVDKPLAASLRTLVDGGIPFAPLDVDDAAEQRRATERMLDERISELLSRGLQLELRTDGLHLGSSSPIDDLLAVMCLDAELFTRPERRSSWAEGQRSVRLTDGPPPVGEQTTLVVLHAVDRADPTVKRSWTQRLDLRGLDAARRDNALIADYLGPSRFQAWLRSQLDGESEAGQERWSDPDGGRAAGTIAHDPLADLFTIETMLARWARNPAAFEARLPELAAMLVSFRESFERITDPDVRQAALDDLAEVEPFLGSMLAATKAAAHA